MFAGNGATCAALPLKKLAKSVPEGRANMNTHWHLDHVSGNPELRAAYPDLKAYASTAIKGALTGFLAASAKESAGYREDPPIPPAMRDDIRADTATIGNGAALRPDIVVGGSGPMTIGGRALTVNLAPGAVTAGDVWLYDAASRVAVLGDLVTLPAPFLDTACPEGWKDALAHVAATPFEVAIPGHGRLLHGPAQGEWGWSNRATRQGPPSGERFGRASTP